MDLAAYMNSFYSFESVLKRPAACTASLKLSVESSSGAVRYSS